MTGRETVSTTIRVLFLELQLLGENWVAEKETNSWIFLPIFCLLIDAENLRFNGFADEFDFPFITTQNPASFRTHLWDNGYGLFDIWISGMVEIFYMSSKNGLSENTSGVVMINTDLWSEKISWNPTNLASKDFSRVFTSVQEHLWPMG